MFVKFNSMQTSHHMPLALCFKRNCHPQPVLLPISEESSHSKKLLFLLINQDVALADDKPIPVSSFSCSLALYNVKDCRVMIFKSSSRTK